MPRYYMGVDWGDEQHGVCVQNEAGTLVWEDLVAHTPKGLRELGPTRGDLAWCGGRAVGGD